MIKQIFLLLTLLYGTQAFAGNATKSKETLALMNLLNTINGKKTLSGTMANVNWNINEAQWVNKHTGKWPALNGFDFIHHVFSSPGGWVDYTNTSVVEQWHEQGGIVSIMWHWNVLANNKSDYSFNYGTGEKETTFDVKKIFSPSSPEYEQMIKDIDQVAGYLKLLRDKGIPVLWRPLHEAGGMWFWWGRDAAACNELWKVMYQRFQDAGLDNLIWVWTSAASWGKPYSDGYRWYPGDEYVDIVSIDVYNNADANNIYSTCYQMLQMESPSKLIALTECGNVADIKTQWNSGSKWLYFMPWYDWERTNNPNSSAFNITTHSSASIAWWNNAFSCDFVLTREDVKELMTADISPVTKTQEVPHSVYRLDGRKVAKPSRGINIIDGKKVIVK